MRRAFLADSIECADELGLKPNRPGQRQHHRRSGEPPVPMYRVIGPTAAVALLVLFLVGIARVLADIVIRAITIAHICGCGCWLMGAFWGTLFQVVVAPMQ
jgi:hypothetical protein